MSHLRYRSEIDGLRAVAVLGVVLYHIGLGFSGGYVGVDVFFVISGFLITGIILKDLDAGTFSMWDFWVRRIRRILPAVTVMVLASLALGYWILEAGQFQALAKSTIAQSLMGANIYFWLDSGYFAEASEMKPLLHTWSLAVEEQFYVIFPLLLLAFSGRFRRFTFPAILFVAFTSLALSCWALIYKPGANFFLLPTRAWELMAGAALAFIVRKDPETPRRLAEASSWLGLLLIAVAMFGYDKDTPFPGWYAIAPVAGTSLIIWANSNQRTKLGKMLSLRPVVFVGLISYSLYLWHWTLLVFAKHITIEITTLGKFFILTASFLCAIVSWKWVESPFRNKKRLSGRQQAFSFAAVSTLFVLALSLIILEMNGMPRRFQDDFDVLREDMSWRGDEYIRENPIPVNIGRVLSGKKAANPRFVYWGDSHALAESEVVDQCAEALGLYGVSFINHSRTPVTGVFSDRMRDHIEYSEVVKNYIFEHKIRNVILVARWSGLTNGQNSAEKQFFKSEYQSGLMESGDDVSDISTQRTQSLLRQHLVAMAQEFKKHGVRVWLIKQVPESNNVFTAQDFYRGKKYPYFNDLPEQFTTSKQDHLKRQAASNVVLDNLPADLIKVIDPTPYFYKNNNKLKVYSERAYYSDDDHLTRAGAKHYLTEMFEEIFTEIAEQ